MEKQFTSTYILSELFDSKWQVHYEMSKIRPCPVSLLYFDVRKKIVDMAFKHLIINLYSLFIRDDNNKRIIIIPKHIPC